MTTESQTLVELFHLETIDQNTYISTSPSYCPGGYGVAYGGHVYAQAAWAAAQTVAANMIIHNVHGFFTLPGLPDRPYIYTIEHISQGRGYCTRSITVRQPTKPCTAPFTAADGKKELGAICFKSLCSFKRDEPRDLDHQPPKDIRKEYASVLDNIKYRDHPMIPSVDAPWYLRYEAQHKPPERFPGLHMRKVDMTALNTSITSPLQYRQLNLYHLRGSIPSSLPNLHAVAHLYASDRNSLYLIGNALNVSDRITKIGSLSHSVVFHVNSADMAMEDDREGLENEGKWWVHENWTPRTGHGRAMHESRTWRSDGLHIASSWQEGLLRVGEGVTYGDGILRGLGKL